jgi:isoleucyl-tRNA synthetase
MIQEARKNSGFEVSDRINLKYHSTDDQVKASILANLEVIKSEVLALEFVEAKGSAEPTTVDEELNVQIWIEKA